MASLRDYWLNADPRISNLPPAWLATRADWRALLGAMSREDVDWLGEHWRLADGPALSTRWPNA